MVSKRLEMVRSFLGGRYEADTDENEEAISDLENLNPSLDELAELLESDFLSAQGAALYILYNRSEKFPDRIMKRLKWLSVEGDRRVRRWAEANLED